MGWVESSINAFFNGLTQLIAAADKIGQLSVEGVWALFTMVLIGYIFYNTKTQKESAQLILEARIKDAEADGMMAEAVEKLADQIKELRYRMDKNGATSA